MVVGQARPTSRRFPRTVFSLLVRFDKRPLSAWDLAEVLVPCFSSFVFRSIQSSLLGRMAGRRRRGTDANNTANGIELSLYGLSPHARAAPELYSFGNKAIRMLSGLCAFAIALRMLCDSVARKILLRVYCIRTTVVELQCYHRAGLEMFFSSEPAGRR